MGKRYDISSVMLFRLLVKICFWILKEINTRRFSLHAPHECKLFRLHCSRFAHTLKVDSPT